MVSVKQYVFVKVVGCLSLIFVTNRMLNINYKRLMKSLLMGVRVLKTLHFLLTLFQALQLLGGIMNGFLVSPRTYMFTKFHNTNLCLPRAYLLMWNKKCLERHTSGFHLIRQTNLVTICFRSSHWNKWFLAWQPNVTVTCLQGTKSGSLG